MKHCLSLVVFFFLLGHNSWAQGQETLEPLRFNTVLQEQTQQRVSSRNSTTFLYEVDTLALPFEDDFFVDRQKRYDADSTTPGLQTILDWYFRVNGAVVDTQRISNVPTFYYTKNGLGLVDTTPNDTLFIVFYEDLLPIDTIGPVWTASSAFINGTTVSVTQLPADAVYINQADTIWVAPDNDKSLDVIDDPENWSTGEGAYVNNHYPVNPPSVGVATFDGVDGLGDPYDYPSETSYGIADFLTSKPINLERSPLNIPYTAADSIYFSFFYQAQGFGEKPNSRDSLVLEFYAVNQKDWIRVWSTPGDTLADFEQVLIPVTDTAWLQNGFRFRFKNFASLYGSLDHWHVDYIRINENRNSQDFFKKRTTFMYPNGSLLKDFHSMPWEHYKNDTLFWMNDTLFVSMRNLWSSTENVANVYNVFDENGVQVFQSSGSFASSGGIPVNSFEILKASVKDPPNLFFYPINNSSRRQFTVEVTSVVAGNNPEKVSFLQDFSTFYAYDDGTAEKAYSLPAPGGKVCMEFNTTYPDTLKAVYFYFPKLVEDLALSPFRLKIWSSLAPETEIYANTTTFSPVYTNRLNKLVRMELDNPIVVSGQWYLGFEHVGTTLKIPIGFDENNDNQSKIFWDGGLGWRPSSFTGSLMIRPDFGIPPDPPVSVGPEVELATSFEVKAFPNPTTGQVQLELKGSSGSSILHLMDLQGRVLENRQVMGDRAQLELGYLPNGIYLLQVMDAGTSAQQHLRLVVNH